MKAYLIDPFARTITEVGTTGKLQSIYDLTHTDTITTVGLGHGRTQDVIYLDDEGLYVEDQRFFMLEGYGQPLAGRGLVLGTDQEGDSTSPSLSLSQVKGLITWARPDLKLAGFENMEGEQQHPVFGKVHVIGHRPHFTTDAEEREPTDKQREVYEEGKALEIELFQFFQDAQASMPAALVAMGRASATLIAHLSRNDGSVARPLLEEWVDAVRASLDTALERAQEGDDDDE